MLFTREKKAINFVSSLSNIKKQIEINIVLFQKHETSDLGEAGDVALLAEVHFFKLEFTWLRKGQME